MLQLKQQYTFAIKTGTTLAHALHPQQIFKIRANMHGSQAPGGSKGHVCESSCAACQRPDSAEDMVQCDHCDIWKHYSCAGVNESVAGRSFVCGDCSVQQTDDVISVRTTSSRSSATSTISVCLSQLVERQRLERARLELELQRRHLDEQQQLIDKAIGGEEMDDRRGEGSSEVVNKTTPEAPSKPIGTTFLPETPLGPLDRRSKAQLDAPKSAASVMVSIPVTALEPKTVKYLQGKKNPQAAFQDLRSRVEQCEKRANPTPDQLADLHSQLELCRKLLEGIQTGAAVKESIQQPPKTAASMSRVVSNTGAIPKANRSLLTVPEEDRKRSDNQSDDGAVGGTTSPEEMWPLKNPVSQTGQPPVSRAVESAAMCPNDLEPPGKRQALSHSIENTIIFAPDHCPTTNNPLAREQLRFVARPDEIRSPPTNLREQLRQPLAHSNDAIVSDNQPKSLSTDLLTRNPPSRAVETSQPPRMSESYQQNQAIPHQDPVRPTQQQLAARQSLAKELPRFSGDPAEWPIFISNYRYTTEACGFTDSENMLRLQRCLSGPALETVRSRLVLPAAVPQVIETLRLRFGRPELLINALLRKVREIPAPKSDKLEGIIDFGMAVQALCDHIEAANELAHLSNPSLLQELVAKLPADQRMMWAGYKRGFQHVDLKTFGDYMASVVRDATSVVTFEPEKRNCGRERPKNRGFVNSHATEGSSRSVDSSSEPEQPKQFVCAHCHKGGHRVRECNAFKQLHALNEISRHQLNDFCLI